MSGEINIEMQIREAMDGGEFVNLRGHGKPLDLDAYFNTPEDLRMAFAMLKSIEFVPEEVELLRKIAPLKDEIAQANDGPAAADLMRRLSGKQLAFNIAVEKYKRKR